jgi:hypothetical protein
MGLTDSPLCRKCGVEEETSAHILCKCEALAWTIFWPSVAGSAACALLRTRGVKHSGNWPQCVSVLGLSVVRFCLPTVCIDEQSSLLLYTNSAVPLISCLLLATPVPILENNLNYQFYMVLTVYMVLTMYITLRITGFVDFLHSLIFIKENKISGNGSVHVFRWKVPTSSVDYSTFPSEPNE